MKIMMNKLKRAWKWFLFKYWCHTTIFKVEYSTGRIGAFRIDPDGNEVFESWHGQYHEHDISELKEGG